MISMDNGASVKRFDDFNMIVVQGHEDPVTPDFSHFSTATPQRIGARKYGQKTESKPMNIPIVIHDSDWSRREQAYNDLKAFLFDDLGDSIPVKFIRDYEPDKYYTVECSGISTPIRKQNHDEFEVSCIAYDPYKYSILQNDEITWGNEVLTFGSHSYTLGHENASAEFMIAGNQTIEIDVIGLALQPTIQITGTATNLMIENQGKKIEVGTFSSATWTIDTEKFISYLNGNEKIIKMDKFLLRKGLNQVKFTGSNLNLEVTMRFRDRWL